MQFECLSGNTTLSLRAFQSIFKYSADDQHRCGVSMERETLLAAERAHKTHLEHLKHGDIIGEYDAAVAALRPNKRLHQFLSDEVRVLMVDQWDGQKAKPGESQCKVQTTRVGEAVLRAGSRRLREAMQRAERQAGREHAPLTGLVAWPQFRRGLKLAHVTLSDGDARDVFDALCHVQQQRRSQARGTAMARCGSVTSHL